MNPYYDYAAQFARLVADGKALPLGGMAANGRPCPQPGAPIALVFSPHPDDECITGALPLRLLRECRMRVLNIAVTLGRKVDRRQTRWQELQAACGWLGFDLERTAPEGLDKIHPTTRERDPAHWSAATDVIASLLVKHQPHAIFFPHEGDWHPAHVGTHWLVMDALKTMRGRFCCRLIETEFWGQMTAPNLMVESSVRDVADLQAGLSFHVGEVKRNAYHLRLPAWMLDNVRRGAELTSGSGSAAPDFSFATLYRLRQWKHGQLEDVYAGGRQLGKAEPPSSLLGL